MSNAVFCIASSEFQADSIVAALRRAGIVNGNVSALLLDPRELTDGVGGVAKQGAVGGALGGLAGLGAVAMPGVGPLLAAGPLVTAIRGSQRGGLAGTLVRQGMEAAMAQRYEGRLRGGAVVLCVHGDQADDVQRARRVFADADAHDVTIVQDNRPVAHEPSHG
jgi:hypothetical protein